MSTMYIEDSQINNCYTPAQWVEYIKKQFEIVLSERSLRERAREFGLFYPIGRDMLISKEQFIKLYLERPCDLNSTNAAKSGGSKETSTNFHTVNTTEKALAHLTRLAHPE